MRHNLIPRFLPENYRQAATEGSVLMALLVSMESMHAPVEELLGQIDDVVSPARTPEAFVPMLAGWLGLDRYLDWSGGRPGKGTPRFRGGLPALRRLLAAMPELSRERGTGDSLRRLLTIATACAGFRIEEDRARSAHLRVTAPAVAQPFADLIHRITDGERPAHATYEIIFDAGASSPPSALEQE